MNLSARHRSTRHHSTRQWRAFLALAVQKSFTRAAVLLHLSQLAFSALAGSLEEVMGQGLFDRSTRHVDLSSEGQVFEAAARRVLAEFETAVGGARDRAALRRGRAAVALLPSLAASWLPDVLARYRADYPGVDIEVQDVLSQACVEAVRRGRAAFALAAHGLCDLALQHRPASDRAPTRRSASMLKRS